MSKTEHRGTSTSILTPVLVVEHAAAPSGTLSHGALNLPKLEYQGFEPSPYNDADEQENVEDLINPVSTISLRLG